MLRAASPVQVKTSFGKFQVAYDPVTGMATDNVTAGYSFPAGGEGLGGGGLVDVSAGAGEHGTHATPDMQRQVRVMWPRGRRWEAGGDRRQCRSRPGMA